MEPIILSGTSALPEFRRSTLEQEAARRLPAGVCERIEAQFAYFLDVRKDIDDTTLRQSLALLNASGFHRETGGFYVTPRKGTISPWSSKATDIFHNCGLDSIARIERGIYYRVLDAKGAVVPLEALSSLLPVLHDRMTEGVYRDVADLFAHREPAEMCSIDILAGGREALDRANVAMGLALSADEIDYLYENYRAMGRNPTDVELVMFGQVNSEHCRHKIFRAEWIVDGVRQERGLFDMIRHTYECNPRGTLSAYKDNSAVLVGHEDEWFETVPPGPSPYRYTRDAIDMMIKVETHNHPTAISPFPGAATGVGGEIRDEGATGTGGRSKAGLCGFMVSNLNLPDFPMPWEDPSRPFPSRLATPLAIMLEGPIGGAGFGNEYGRPQLCGFFKTYEEEYNGRFRGYHKPIMLAGGMGNIKREHTHKRAIPPSACILQIGGPAMRIGLGGGAASSMDTGSNAEELDFDSVQRDNAEMQRRCQEVISACMAMGADNPILSIHDIGAGGLSNGCPELVEEVGARFRLRDIHNEEPSMSPMEIWCCEAQERYVLAVSRENLEAFLEVCRRERCEVAVIGEATGDERLVVEDEFFGNRPIDLDLHVLLGKPPKMVRDVKRRREEHAELDVSGITIEEAAARVLRLPAVAAKTFLVTIADRSITGLVARDQMVGPYQRPLADVAVTTTGFHGFRGEAMALGERSKTAVVDAPASGRMALAEALLNLAAADVGALENVKLSANWMAACNEEGEDANLFDTVRTIGMELCPELEICIPVGKDSLSMRTVWEDADGTSRRQVAPLSLCITAFAPVRDVRKTVTPDLKRGVSSALLLLDLGGGKNRLGGASALGQVFNRVGANPPDLDSGQVLKQAFQALQQAVEAGLLLAYHDRSDGGLFVTLAEMAFGGRCGICCAVEALGADDLAVLFSEELGAVMQVEADRVGEVEALFREVGLGHMLHRIGAPSDDGRLTITRDGVAVYRESITELERAWWELTYRMQGLRDNPACALQEYDSVLDADDPGLSFELTFDPAAPFHIGTGARPKMAILREQGINGQVEMAAAFDRAGFDSIDVHMTDLLAGRLDLAAFAGLVACGGFSYGDVLGAGSGWAKSILFNPRLKEMFAAFFARPDAFALGVCNGCQMISQLKEIIPGAEHWPAFRHNVSEQFEARYVTVAIADSPSVLLQGMAGSRLGIPVAHGEGYCAFATPADLEALRSSGLITMRYVDNTGKVTERYPFNPNGSAEGITGMTNADGRVTIMMPHPERAFRRVQLSYAPPEWDGEEGPWLRLFQNARRFVE